MGKFMAVWSLIGQGRMVADPVFWKKMQAVGQPALAGFLIGLVAILKGTKYEIQISDETLGLIAGGLFAIVNWVLTHVTTNKDIRILPGPTPDADEAVQIPVAADATEPPAWADVQPQREPTIQNRRASDPVKPTEPSKPAELRKPIPVDPNLYRGG